MLDRILDEPLSNWLKRPEQSDTKEHIVISSRIRLARNFKDIVFTNRQDKEALAKVDTMMRGILGVLKKADGHEYSNISLDKLSDAEREILVEKHLISPAMAQKAPYRALVVSDDAAVAVMVNEEDHIRIQAMAPGLDLSSAYAHAVQVDDAIESKYDYAFNEHFGYLTACPTNVGTGMRASVMMHLPALVMTGRINRVVRSILQLGYSVRGLYGEGSDALGHIYQVSNQLTMGISEEDTIAQLEKVINGLVAEERKARQALHDGDWEAFEDRVWRAYGTLEYARRLSGEEALSLLSDVQLGMDMEILPKKGDTFFNELIVITRPNFLAKYAGKDAMTASERDSYRAKVIRSYIEK